jgi:IS1 family transposase/transposase-like protein
MLCPTCALPARRFGRDRHGRQRFQCSPCRRTFTEARDPADDGRRIPPDRAAFCLRLLLEGTSIRSVERLTGTHRDTIMSLLVTTGCQCQRFMEREHWRLRVEDVQADEVWGFVGCKEKTRERKGYAEEFGDAYCYIALERRTKLVITWHLGKRCPEDTLEIAEKLRRATRPDFQLTTDGYRPYRTAVPFVFGRRIDFAQLVKVYGQPEDDDHRYSPARVVDAYPVPVIGSPDPDRICTSHVERGNLSLRMTVRRMTRLTNAFSKKWENHEAALALYFAYYNYCRPHMTLTGEAAAKTTPAMASGLTSRVWRVEDLLAAVYDSNGDGQNGSTHS